VPRTSISGRHLRRGRERRLRPDLRPLAEAAPPPTPASASGPTLDPVRIAVLAMEGLARASMRASFTGIEVRVTVPDATIAAIFQAAIAETAQSRSTDRLIRIVVD
jgi:hypothetical protein